MLSQHKQQFSYNNHKIFYQIRASVMVKGITHLLIMGDFNCPKITTYHSEPFSDQQAFYDMTQDLFLVQHVEKPTRYREGQKPSLLDLI